MTGAAQWDELYGGTPPWEIGRPQPALAALGDTFAGRFLDAGCGTGEHALLAASLGADALGVDVSSVAIARAREKAVQRGLVARFEVHDALELSGLAERFDTAVDSGLYHALGDVAVRARYATELAEVVEPGGTLYLMCFSPLTPGDWGPARISKEELRVSFAERWAVLSIEPSAFEINPGMPVGRADAWLAAFRRR